MELILRATAVFFFLWIVMRAMGKRELVEMTSFELVLVIVMGDAVQQGITQEDYSVTGAILAVGTIALWVLATSYMSFRWKRSRPVIDGLPTVLVQNGEVLQEALKIERMSEDELLAAAREKGLSNLNEIRFAILEGDGKFSFIKND